MRQLIKRCEAARCVTATPVPGAATAAAAVASATAAPTLALTAAPNPAPNLADSSAAHSTPAASASDPAATAWFDAAWCRAKAALKVPEGGAWRDAFDASSELEEAPLRRLAGVLDRVFLGGEMRRQLRLREREENAGGAEECRKVEGDGEMRRQLRRETKAGGGGDGSPADCTGGKVGKGTDCSGKGGSSLGFSVDDDDRGEADW